MRHGHGVLYVWRGRTPRGTAAPWVHPVGTPWAWPRNTAQHRAHLMGAGGGGRGASQSPFTTQLITSRDAIRYEESRLPAALGLVERLEAERVDTVSSFGLPSCASLAWTGIETETEPCRVQPRRPQEKKCGWCSLSHRTREHDDAHVSEAQALTGESPDGSSLSLRPLRPH